MKLDRIYIKNFRRLEEIEIKLNDAETILVGPNNSGKTSVFMVFKLFVKQDCEFKIYDFSAPLLQKIDMVGQNGHEIDEAFPSLDLDLWFSIDPETEYGRVANFLPSIVGEYSEIGVRISFSLNDLTELINDFMEVKKSSPDKRLSMFLSEGGHLKRYFSLKYFKLKNIQESSGNNSIEVISVEKKDGEKTLKSIIAVDFVDAQRNIDDKEVTRGTRLSVVLSKYYKANLEQPDNDKQAITVINESNEKLSEHYEDQFKGLVRVISNLGFPSVNDRRLKILSTLNPEAALRGNTTLLYVDEDSNHQLPESYNGLGFKNLIYIAIQVSHFQRKWLSIRQGKPLCHLIFIEEPEVHLHAQVQQTFIRQISLIIEETAKQEDGELTKPQLIISTHSSHIIDEGDFTTIRYFQRCESGIDSSCNRKIATKVLSLADFNPTEDHDTNISFLKRYLKLAHCDLFFSDGAILVEGTVEKMLLPKFIEKTVKSLSSTYLTTLEVGGAYAHRMMRLMDFLSLPTLIVSDLDSIDPQNNQKACRADTQNAISSNKTITSIVGQNAISDLLEISNQDSAVYNINSHKSLVFQNSVCTQCYDDSTKMIPRTFEESFIYENLNLVRSGNLEAFVKLNEVPNFEEDYRKIYLSVKSPNYKKAEFAINIMNSDTEWSTPKYLADGLKWLASVVKPEEMTLLEQGQATQ